MSWIMWPLPVSEGARNVEDGLRVVLSGRRSALLDSLVTAL